jgi:hypothetical protein
MQYITFSQFVAHYNANHQHVPYATLQIIRREAVARLKGRWSDGRANVPLDFSDLAQRLEAAIGG